MAILESVKELFEKVTGWARPCGRDLDAVLRQRKANAFRFKDDGVIPNNPKLPCALPEPGLTFGQVRPGGRVRKAFRAQWLGRFLAESLPDS
jgi:hypothetical protein